MNPASIQSGVYSGLILSSSVSVPSEAQAITYTVSINVGSGAVTFSGVSPQPNVRWTEYMPVGSGGEVPLLNPFPPGHRVPLHIERRGATLLIWIDRGEIPAFGGCP